GAVRLEQRREVPERLGRELERVDEGRGGRRPARSTDDAQRRALLVPEQHRGGGNVEDLDHRTGHDAGDPAWARGLGERAGHPEQRGGGGTASARLVQGGRGIERGGRALCVRGEEPLLEREERMVVVE